MRSTGLEPGRRIKMGFQNGSFARSALHFHTKKRAKRSEGEKVPALCLTSHVRKKYHGLQLRTRTIAVVRTFRNFQFFSCCVAKEGHQVLHDVWRSLFLACCRRSSGVATVRRIFAVAENG